MIDLCSNKQIRHASKPNSCMVYILNNNKNQNFNGIDFFQILMKNPTYVTTTLSAVFDDALVLGSVYFAPKYIENQFSLPASTTGLIIGECF